MGQSTRICSWNVNGLRAVSNKGFIPWLMNCDFDIVCLQEIKAEESQLNEEIRHPISHPYSNFNSAIRKGYSGVANYCKSKAISVEFGFRDNFGLKPYLINSVVTEKKFSSLIYNNFKILNDNSLEGNYQELARTLNQGEPEIPKTTEEEIKTQIKNFNQEGRVILSEHKLDQQNTFLLLNIYFPNGGSGLERLKFKLEFYELFLLYIKELEKSNPFIVITGDYNTAHHPIDLARPDENTNTSGFMPMERLYLDRLEDLGFIDSFRMMNPDSEDSYTWWSFRTAARSRNVGWRIDYFFISQALKPYLKSASILQDIEGSDHCPISITLSA